MKFGINCSATEGLQFRGTVLWQRLTGSCSQTDGQMQRSRWLGLMTDDPRTFNKSREKEVDSIWVSHTY